MPEVLKRVDIDDILLKFSNKMLVENELPDQLAVMNLVPVPKKLQKLQRYRINITNFQTDKSNDPKPYSSCN